MQFRRLCETVRAVWLLFGMTPAALLARKKTGCNRRQHFGCDRQHILQRLSTTLMSTAHAWKSRHRWHFSCCVLSGKCRWGVWTQQPWDDSGLYLYTAVQPNRSIVTISVWTSVAPYTPLPWSLVHKNKHVYPVAIKAAVILKFAADLNSNWIRCCCCSACRGHTRHAAANCPTHNIYMYIYIYIYIYVYNFEIFSADLGGSECNFAQTHYSHNVTILQHVCNWVCVSHVKSYFTYLEPKFRLLHLTEFCLLLTWLTWVKVSLFLNHLSMMMP